MNEHLLAAVAREMHAKHGCHTLILYGSRARGDATSASDIDLIGLRARGPALHDARKYRGAYLDAFIYPEKDAKAAHLLRAREGIVLFQRGDTGDSLLAKIARLHRKGPERLSSDAVKARKVWLRKMLVRAKRDDAEAHFRRAWLLFALLEEYFVLRGHWYDGPKAGLAWLGKHDKPALRCFEKALKPNARLAAIENLVALVTA